MQSYAEADTWEQNACKQNKAVCLSYPSGGELCLHVKRISVIMQHVILVSLVHERLKIF